MDNVTRLLMQGAAGAAGGSTYVDDVFSTYLHKGTGAAKTINNGVDLTEGGLVWQKCRTLTQENIWIDSERGLDKFIRSNANNGNNTTSTSITSFNDNGFTLGSYGDSNQVNQDYGTWTFRKAKGFFDIVTWTGNSTAGRQIAHNLGSVPGCIMVKNISAGYEWAVYHRSLGGTKNLQLSATGPAITSEYFWNNTNPTATHFTTGLSTDTNRNGDNFVAYLFAGGESTAATARSVQFDQNYIKSGSTSDYTMGTGDFTVECWWRPTEIANQGIFQISDGANGLSNSNWENTIAVAHNSNNWVTYGGNGNGDSSDYPVTVGTWYHLAYVKTGGSHKLYVNGIPVITRTDSTNYYGTTVAIGGYYSTGYTNRGYVSNFRITKGQALYTAPFEPSTTPLTTTSQGATSSNVKLLCCNNASVTGSTVTGATISVGSGSPTARTNSPFDDLEGFQFGEEEDQNIIKTGSYKGNGSTNGPEIYLGWEPQWLLIKLASSASYNWYMLDSMRGVVANGNDKLFKPNTTAAEETWNPLEFTSTGFKLTHGSTNAVNGSSQDYIYMAIRRPDGLVGKPAEAGTDVFTMVNGVNAANGNPTYISNGVRDFGVFRKPTTTENWNNFSRLTQGTNILLDTAGVESSLSVHLADFNNGMVNAAASDVAIYQSWMWKRGQGFDVVTWAGNNTSVVRNHSLGRTPEMIWYKCRSSARNWRVYHKGLNGGTNPEDYAIQLNAQSPEYSNTSYMTGTAPTSISFVAGNDDDTNGSGKTYIAMLFASVDGISKVDSYTGNGSSQTITTGFSPRFVIIRRVDGSQDNWVVLDTTRGWGAGNDNYISLNRSDAQSSGDMGAPTSTGFTLTSDGWVNYNTGKYIYYAHA